LNDERFVVIKFPNSGLKYILPIVPGEDYQIAVDKEGKLLVKGANKDGIELYQSVLQYDPYKQSFNIYNGLSVENRIQIIERKKQEEMQPFKQLLAENKLSKQFYQLIETDRDCFYAFVTAWLYSWDFMKIYRNPMSVDDEVAKNEINQSMQALFAQYKPDDVEIMKSPAWQMYAEFIYIRVYQQFLLKRLDKSNIEQLMSEKNISFWFTRIKALFAGKSLEDMLAVSIYANVGPDGFSEYKESIPVYEYFKTTFPDSPYLIYFQDKMKRTIEFYRGKKTNDAIKFIQNGDNINTFEELIARLKGKKIYVDVWATWCTPCRGEFKYKSTLEKVLDANDVIPLYISLDEKEQEEKWKAIVYTQNLNGYHFRANKSVIDDMNKIYQAYNGSGNVSGSASAKKSFSIPWYILIDENGKIINANAPRPSNADEVEKLIRK